MDKPRIKKPLILLLILVAGVFVLFDLSVDQLEPRGQAESQRREAITRVVIEDTEFQVEVASSPVARMSGLSGRSGLADGAGMLFVFDTPEFHAFWMKDMNFSIDIIWIDQDHNVVHVEDVVSPDTYPQSFIPTREALYVLEINAGFSQDLGIGVGDKVEFLY